MEKDFLQTAKEMLLSVGGRGGKKGFGGGLRSEGICTSPPNTVKMTHPPKNSGYAVFLCRWDAKPTYRRFLLSEQSTEATEPEGRALGAGTCVDSGPGTA